MAVSEIYGVYGVYSAQFMKRICNIGINKML